MSTPNELASEPSIIDVIQRRIDEPHYIPTGPTYGDVTPEKSREEFAREVGIVNYNRGVQHERERCARIAEDLFRDRSGARIVVQTIRQKWGACIAAAIRRGE